jgi:hypothetical protein
MRDYDAVAKAVVVQSDGSIAIAGVENNGTGASYYRIDRVTSTGQLDTSWGNTVPKTGRVLFRPGTHRGRQAFEGLAQQSDGTLVAVGRYYAEGGPTQWAVADFAGTGGETPTLAITEQGTNFATLYDVAVQDDKILAAGEVNWTWGVARWLPSSGAGGSPTARRLLRHGRTRDHQLRRGRRGSRHRPARRPGDGRGRGRAEPAAHGARAIRRRAGRLRAVAAAAADAPVHQQASPVVEGTTLTSTTGTWTGFTELRVRWQRCATADPATADCPFIRDDGSTGSSDPAGERAARGDDVRHDRRRRRQARAGLRPDGERVGQLTRLDGDAPGRREGDDVG